eukprot:7315117-Pyramimonas_sp.AAC.1
MLSERAVDSIFLGVDPESAWLVGRIDPKASRPEARWVIESSSSFVIHPEAAVLPKEPESAADERGPGGAAQDSEEALRPGGGSG